MRATVVLLSLLPSVGLGADPKTRDVVFDLPRLTTRAEDGPIKKALEAVPSAQLIYVRHDNLRKGKPGFVGISVRYDTAKADVGDIAKALATMGGDKSQPAAALSLAQSVPLSDKQFAALEKELMGAKGIDWGKSNRNWLALDEAGGAKFEEIRAAYKKAGVGLITGLDD